MPRSSRSEGNERLRGDALVAAELAEAGARGAAELVAINLAGSTIPASGVRRTSRRLRVLGDDVDRPVPRGGAPGRAPGTR